MFDTYDKAGHPHYLMEGKLKASTYKELVGTGLLIALDAPADTSVNGVSVGSCVSIAAGPQRRTLRNAAPPIDQ